MLDRTIGGFERRFQVVRRAARDARPDFGSGPADSLPIHFGPCTGHGNAKRGRLWQSMTNCAKMPDQLCVTQEAKIGWTEAALPINRRFIVSDHEGGARAAAFDAEKHRLRRRLLTFR